MEQDLCEIALLKDLSELDRIGNDDVELRKALLVSALETAEQLKSFGGGSLADKIDAITAAIKDELGGAPC
ncbi:MAG: hypothetical protein IT381_25430 [Deltaproteobacteria bacterium]|nr:hypothetical protein [Deltaproteobacteria bacterium]